jgi:hypothetical protein
MEKNLDMLFHENCSQQALARWREDGDVELGSDRQTDNSGA